MSSDLIVKQGLGHSERNAQMETTVRIFEQSVLLVLTHTQRETSSFFEEKLQASLRILKLSYILDNSIEPFKDSK